MTDNPISYEIINNLHPTLILLLTKICIVEKVSMADLVTMIDQCRSKTMSFHAFSSLFCANYFAQSSTLQGHKAARHGAGKFIARTAKECIHINHKRYDLSLIMTNNSVLSEDCSRFNHLSF